ncbi:MAG: phosphatidylserine decarboxylase family protein [bacterium]
MPRQFIIAREGFPFIGIAFVATALLWLVGLYLGCVLMLGVAGFIAFFFRNPERAVPDGEGLIVAPADGRVISVSKNIAAPITGKPSTRVSIFMSVLNVHINRFPIAARVKRSSYHAGKFFVASLNKASEHNERHALVLEDDRGREMVMVQIAGLVARRIVCYMRDGDSRSRGERFGLIRFGSRVDIYLPPEARVEAAVGMRTRAGETVIGRFS